MILLRIGVDDGGGNKNVGGVQGGCTIEGGDEMKKYEYSKASAGWFPIESANFGFQSQNEAAAGQQGQNGRQGQQGQGQNAGQQPRSVNAPPLRSGAGGQNGESDEAFTKISIGKFVDAATVTLMKFGMEDRKKTKSDGKKLRSADIHFLDSVAKYGDSKSRFVFPYMMIQMQHVLIKGWNISASGDDRPSETLELWYDKVAVKYFKTSDGKVWSLADSGGWDQSANEEWKPTGAEAKYFEDPEIV